LRFFADIRDPQTYEPNRTANRILQKITNQTAVRFDSNSYSINLFYTDIALYEVIYKLLKLKFQEKSQNFKLLSKEIYLKLQVL
jgi:hypothetical protein